MSNLFLQEKSEWVWRETLKIHGRAPETRIASSLSSVQIFTALYYSGVLAFYPHNPLHPDRDRCIISKGHGSICMYPILADLGFFSKDELLHVGTSKSILGGIPDPVIPGYETVNGSLGHGLGVGCGIALALKRKQKKQHVFVVTGDGELHEGACWEAIMFASMHGLNNLTMILDNNKIAMLGHTDSILSHGNLPKRLRSFGWNVVEQADGHDVVSLAEKLKKAKKNSSENPTALIAHTIKGKGVPELENQPLSHVMSLSAKQIQSMLGDANG